MNAVATLYEILGVDSRAKPQMLRMAYRRLARTFHPDVNPDPASHEKMARINSAFETLIDPVRRMEYDASLNGGFVQDPSPDMRPSAEAEAVKVRIVHRLRRHRTPIYGIQFEPDHGTMISCSFDNEMIWWDMAVGEPARTARPEGGVVSHIKAVRGDELLAAGVNESQVSLWRLTAGRVHVARVIPSEWVCCLDMDSHGQRVALGLVDRTLHVHDAHTGKPVYISEGHEESVTAVAFSPDGRYIATGSADATVKLWCAADGEDLATIPKVRSTVTALAWSPDGGQLAVAAVDLSIRVFDVRSGGMSKIMFGHERPIEGLAFHPSGCLLASVGRDGAVGLWDTVRGVGHGKIEASHLPLNVVAFGPDGRTLAAGGLDKVLRVWRLYAPQA